MENLTLNFLGEPMLPMRDDIASLRDDVGSLRDDMTVLTGIAMRVDSSLQGLAVELRGLHSQQTSWHFAYPERSIFSYADSLAAG